MSQNSTSDYEAIRNTVARYCVALDSKNWDLLSSVFTSNADAEYPFGKIRSAKSIGDAISERLKDVTTQHALTTQTIEINATAGTASAMTYFTANHFNEGSQEGNAWTVYGKYVDELYVVNGKWVIGKRVCSFMGRTGDRSVMKHSTSEK